MDRARSGDPGWPKLQPSSHIGSGNVIRSNISRACEPVCCKENARPEKLNSKEAFMSGEQKK